MNRPTLEEQLIIERIVYAGKMLGKISREKMVRLYRGLYDAPIYIVRDAMKLFERIMISEEGGYPISKKYIRNPENLSAFMWLIKGDLIEVQKHRYFLGIFKKTVVVSKDNYLKNIKSVFDKLLHEAIKAEHERKEEISYDQRKGWRY